MIHNNKDVLEYWDRESVESMYDKFLINAEIRMIKKELTLNSKILDAGCGEGEGTLEYSKIKDVVVHAVDFSETRLKMAKKRIGERNNVKFQQVDFLGDYSLDKNYDFIVSQRFLINLMEWDLQKRVIIDLMNMLKPGGKLLMCEGSVNGVNQLNEFRKCYGLLPIDIKWHNLFFIEETLIKFFVENGYKLEKITGIGAYYLLTRGVRPFFDKNLSWESEFNKYSETEKVSELLNLNDKFSRVKLWVVLKDSCV